MKDINLVHPIALVEQLMAHALHKTKLETGEIKAIKITKRGIYVYSKLSFKVKDCSPVIGNEVVIYKDDEATIPVEEIQNYITGRPRIQLKKYKGSDVVRILVGSQSTVPCTEAEESETKFDTAIYLYYRELYLKDSPGGNEIINHYKLRPDDYERLDAKHYLLDYQFKSKDDKIAFSLHSRGYTEGLYDSFTGILYGTTPSGQQEEIEIILEDATPGNKIFTYRDLGVRIETSSVNSKSKTTKSTRSVRYKLPSMEINKTIVEHFKDLKTIRKGIVLTNTILPDDLINHIYYYNPIGQDENGLNCTQPIDILVLEREEYNSFNPYLLIEPIRNRNNNEVVNLEEVDRRIISNALTVGYSVIIVRGIQNVTEELLRAADTSLVYVIDDFLSISDVQHKLESVKVNSALIMNKVIGIMDIKRVTYFKMNRTVRDIITGLEPCGNHILTTSFIKVDGEYKNFNSFIIKLLENEQNERLIISKNGITVVSEEVSEITTEVTFNNMISFLAGLSEINIYKQLLNSPIVTLPLEINSNMFKLSAYMEDGQIVIVIKKLSDTVLDDKYLPSLPINTDKYVTGHNISFVLKGIGDFSINNIIGTLVNKYLQADQKVLLIDTDYSIDENAYPQEYRRLLEVIHTTDEQAVYDIVNSRKPNAVILHKVKDNKSVRLMYRIAPLVPNICISSKFTTYKDIYMNFIQGNLSKSQYEYYTNEYCYIANEFNEFEETPTEEEEM